MTIRYELKFRLLHYLFFILELSWLSSSQQNWLQKNVFERVQGTLAPILCYDTDTMTQDCKTWHKKYDKIFRQNRQVLSYWDGKKIGA